MFCELRHLCSLSLITVIVGCTPSEDALENAMKNNDACEEFIEFRSELGNSIVVPSRWSAEDRGASFTITSEDGHAVISALTFAVKGSGSLDAFQDLMVSSQCDGEWQDSPWADIEIGGVMARKRILLPVDDGTDSAWRVYALRNGECYHAILLNSSPIVMELNGDFYETLVQSFKGVSSVP
jgi:hypothetical protein